MRWLWRKIVQLFKPKREVPRPTPTPTGPMEIPDFPGDSVNDGDWKTPDFEYLWDNISVDPERVDQVKDVCDEILGNRHVYEKVQEKIGCPWWYVAALHYRESTLDFRGVLHNGQRIIGKGKKTTWVPKGRGPFNSWEEAAIDALKLKRYDKLDSWTIGECIRRAERYNGLGYRRKGWGEYSPYLFAGSNWHDETGKYVSDGKYSDSAVEKQLGVCSIWKGLEGVVTYERYQGS